MKTRLTLKPGQHGTKALVEKYGDTLVCVRFRYDANLRQRIKTVELIVEKRDWIPPSPRFTEDAIVYLKIRVSDMQMRTKAKEVGARWSPEKQLWYVRFGQIVGSVLEKYIYVDGP